MKHSRRRLRGPAKRTQWDYRLANRESVRSFDIGQRQHRQSGQSKRWSLVHSKLQTAEASLLAFGPSRTKPALLGHLERSWAQPERSGHNLTWFIALLTYLELHRGSWNGFSVLELVTMALTRPNLRNSKSKFGRLGYGRRLPQFIPLFWFDSKIKQNSKSGYSDPGRTLRWRAAGYLLFCCFTSKLVPFCILCTVFAGPFRFDPNERRVNAKWKGRLSMTINTLTYLRRKLFVEWLFRRRGRRSSRSWPVLLHVWRTIIA
jgi:hypothetical protein